MNPDRQHNDERPIEMRISARRLLEAGLSTVEAARKADLLARALRELRDRCGASVAEDHSSSSSSSTFHAWFVPGRIEVLGKHTDYAGGRTMTCALERGFCVLARARNDRAINVFDAITGSSTRFNIGADLEPTSGDWCNYPMTVARRIARNFPGPLRGADLAIASDLPAAAGMSSSSALIIACFMALSRINDLPDRAQYRQNIHDAESLAGYLGTVENGQTYGSLAGGKGVGTFGGSEDHTAILCSLPGQISQYSFCPVRLERRIGVPADHVFAVAVSGVVAEKTGAAMTRYNRVSGSVSAILELWRRESGSQAHYLADLIRCAPDAQDMLQRTREIIGRHPHADFDPQTLCDRVEQFYLENEMIVPAAGDALARLELESFGNWARLSQHLAQTMLGNQVPQTQWLARSAYECGAIAASAFGAGFGGSVWALVAQHRAAEMLERWSQSYAARFPDDSRRACFFQTRPGPAAVEL